MKKIIYAALIMAGPGLIMSCKKESTDSKKNDEKRTVCYKVLDGNNQNPLQGAYLSIAYLWQGNPLTYAGSTDASGNFCFETYTTASQSDLSASYNGYVNFCVSTYGSLTVYLTPVAYLRLHIKNTPPQSSSDQIFINYPGIDCNGNSLLSYAGANVDTTVVMQSNPSGNSISWTSWHNSISADSTNNGIVMSSHDTTFFDLLY